MFRHVWRRACYEHFKPLLMRIESPALTLIVFVAPFALAQSSDTTPGNWTELPIEGNATGCPALVIGTGQQPILAASLETKIVTLSAAYSQYNLYTFAPHPDNVDTWTAYGFPMNLNPKEELTNLSYSLGSNPQGAPVSFASWVETRSNYNQPAVVVGKFSPGASEPDGVTHLFQVDTHKDAYAASSLIDGEGKPIIAWSEGVAPEVKSLLDNANQMTFVDGTTYRDSTIYLRRWDGGTWQELEEPLRGARPALARTSQNTLYLSYVREPIPGNDRSQFEVINVYWDGNTWQPVGEPLVSHGANLSLQHTGFLTGSVFPRVSLVVDEQGSPIIAWIGRDDATASRSKLFVKRWDGESWRDLPDVPLTTQARLVRDVAMTFGDKLVLIVGETEVPEDTRVAPMFHHVMQWGRGELGNFGRALTPSLSDGCSKRPGRAVPRGCCPKRRTLRHR